MWIRVEDEVADHPKLLAAGPVGFTVWLRSICWSARHLTNGFLPADVVPSLTAGCNGFNPEKLVALNLWEQRDGGYSIHDYLEHQPSKEAVLRERAATVTRVQKHRKKLGESPSLPLLGEESNTVTTPVSKADNVSQLMEIWNENRGGLSICRGMNGVRRASARARLAEFPDLDRWRSAIQRVARSPFCLGENDRGWKADIEFLLRPSTLLKIEEGKYDAKKGEVLVRSHTALKERDQEERDRQAEEARRDLQEAESLRARRKEAGLQGQPGPRPFARPAP